MRTTRSLLAVLLTATLLAGLGCKGTSPEVAAAAKSRTLTIWGIFDDSDAYAAAIADYRVSHPYVQVQYRKLRPEEYEQDLVNALAEDRGPDIFLMHNTWVRGYESKISPMPASVNVAELVIKGTIKKEAAYELHQKNLLSIRQMQSAFPDQVVKDAVLTVQEPVKGSNPRNVQKIFGLPLSIDTLALYWNRDLLNAAGIAEPPDTWTEVQGIMKRLTKTDASGNIVQSGAGLGTAKNVERASDILSLLMMQNLTPMTDASGNPTFHRTPPELSGRTFPPGVEALVFYTDFANPNKEIYAWNDSLPNSLDAFVTGQSAMFLGYNYHLPLIRARAPRLKFGIASAPQIPGNPTRNFANYWLYTVSKKSKNPDTAWDFLVTLASEKNAQKYLEKTKKPTALRSLIQSQTESVDLGVFANQILTAESWYHGKDAGAAERVLDDMIDEVVAGENPVAVVGTGVERVAQTINPR